MFATFLWYLKKSAQEILTRIYFVIVSLINIGAAVDILYLGTRTQRILSNLGEIRNSRSVHNAVEHL
jgi:hypothetical protein